jgi:hypothetical protein
MYGAVNLKIRSFIIFSHIIDRGDSKEIGLYEEADVFLLPGL